MKNKFLKSLLVVFALSASFALFSQNIAINNTGTPAAASAILDVNSSNQGVLFPRMTTNQRGLMTYPVTIGLLIYNTSTNCFEYNYTGTTTGWTTLACPCSTAPGTPSVPVALSICVGSSNTTITANSANATTYNWTAAGFTFTGQGDPTITLTVLPPTGNYTITVSATNPCGTSATAHTPVAVVPLHNAVGQTFSWNGPDNYYDGTVQYWAVPACVTTITITTVGGGGGNSRTTNGGLGASLTGSLTVTPGDVLAIMVGGQGDPNPYPGNGTAGGGGGGTFVWDNTTNTLLVAAGGGGGGGHSGTNGANGQTINGSAATLEATTASASSAAGGTGGAGSSGGSAGSSSIFGGIGGCGGAGWGENGANMGGIFAYNGGGTYPEAIANAGYGGPDGNGAGNFGGYGGGAGGADGGGGGGGYNGGGGGNGATGNSDGGGGGSSYFNGTTATSTTTGAANANGSVLIKW